MISKFIGHFTQPSLTLKRSSAGAIRRVKQFMGDKADEKLKGRCAIIK